MPKKGISDLTNKKSHFAYAHGRYYIKLFRTGADRHNGILMSLPSSGRNNEGISEYYKLFSYWILKWFAKKFYVVGLKDSNKEMQWMYL